MRYEIRNLFRKFQGRFEEAAKGNSIDSAINQLIDLHQKRMREKHQVGAFDMPRAQEEFQALVKALSDRGVCKVHSIRSDQRTIASVITFEFRGIVSYFQVGFDPDSRCLSPGKVLQALRINKAIQDGALEFDFLDGDEAYKRVWANGQRRLYSIEILTGSWRALAYYWWDRLRIRLAESDRLRSLNLWLRGR
jgi:CelD/BcsL family acetyltransferase involved in cellulose biosynthesis